MLILGTIALPILAGIILEVLPEFKERRKLVAYVSLFLGITAALVFFAATRGDLSIKLFDLTERLPIFFRIDNIGRIFSVTVAAIWLLAGIFSFEYMKHEDRNKRYYGFYLIVLGVLLALDYSGNLVTFYMFYEFMTVTSLPLVIHSGTKEANMAGLKYLFYSLCGAYCVLFGFYFLYKYSDGLSFVYGGNLNMAAIAGNEKILLISVMLMIFGFGVKAGMLPLHAWLTAAHPVAPAPASAVLSGLIVKCGVLGIIRVVFYLFGADFIRGTWVQYTWMILSLCTVFMGSMMAYMEKVLKRRLAYSTVSQVSYILFGLSVLTASGMEGALLHVVGHAYTKCGLFLCAGAIIYKTGCTRVDELRGIGKRMPVTIWCYTLLSISLIGIPPTAGFVSKWYLCIGALQSGLPVLRWLGPAVLLISALLTAGYLLPITVNGFLPGRDYDLEKLDSKEPGLIMTVPMIILTAVAVLMGIFTDTCIGWFGF